MHYFTHHGDFAKGSLLDNIRRAHVGHHFIDPNKSKSGKMDKFMTFQRLEFLHNFGTDLLALEEKSPWISSSNSKMKRLQMSCQTGFN